MTWVKLDDTFGEDPRWEEAGATAMALYVAMLCYCSRNRTDGHITTARARRLLDLDEPDTAAEALVDAGFLRPEPGGFVVIDYLENQPSREKVEEQRRLKRERQQRWLDSKRGASRDASRDAPLDASQDATRDGAPRDAAPPRPAPPRRKAGEGRAAQPGSAGATPGRPPKKHNPPPHDFRGTHDHCDECGHLPSALAHRAHNFVEDQFSTEPEHPCSVCGHLFQNDEHAYWDLHVA